MNLVKINERFPDQGDALNILRDTWGNKPRCPKFKGKNLKRKKECGTGRIGRWHCSD